MNDSVLDLSHISIPILRQAPFVNRDRFARFLNSKGLRRNAVEIGTHRGYFARNILDYWEGLTLYCVDPYSSGYDSGDPASYGDREKDYQEACFVLTHHISEKRCFILRNTSEQASSKFGSNTLDFVYIDGCHRRDSVTFDIKVWWEKVKPGGILAGHDFICPNEDKGGWGRIIQPVVLEFALTRDLTINLVLEEDNSPWSYYLEKPN